MKSRNIWFAEKDNYHAGDAPRFLGQHRVNIHGELPVDYFLRLFSESLLKHTVFHSNLYVVHHRRKILRLTVPDVKGFLEISLAMTYITCSWILQFWSTKTSLRLGIVTNVMSVDQSF